MDRFSILWVVGLLGDCLEASRGFRDGLRAGLGGRLYGWEVSVVFWKFVNLFVCGFRGLGEVGGRRALGFSDTLWFTL